MLTRKLLLIDKNFNTNSKLQTGKLFPSLQISTYSFRNWGRKLHNTAGDVTHNFRICYQVTKKQTTPHSQQCSLQGFDFNNLVRLSNHTAEIMYLLHIIHQNVDWIKFVHEEKNYFQQSLLWMTIFILLTETWCWNINNIMRKGTNHKDEY